MVLRATENTVHDSATDNTDNTVLPGRPSARLPRPLASPGTPPHTGAHPRTPFARRCTHRAVRGPERSRDCRPRYEHGSRLGHATTRDITVLLDRLISSSHHFRASSIRLGHACRTPGVAAVRERSFGPSQVPMVPPNSEMANRHDPFCRGLRRNLQSVAPNGIEIGARPFSDMITPTDPSEAVVRRDIAGLLKAHFEILGEWSWRGTLPTISCSRTSQPISIHENAVSLSARSFPTRADSSRERAHPEVDRLPAMFKGRTNDNRVVRVVRARACPCCPWPACSALSVARKTKCPWTTKAHGHLAASFGGADRRRPL